MFNKKYFIFIIVMFLLGLLYNSFYVVNEGQEGVVLRLGKYHATALPGLHVKWPMIDTVQLFDKRLQITNSDKGTLYWRIQDVVRYSQQMSGLPDFDVLSIGPKTIGIAIIDKQPNRMALSNDQRRAIIEKMRAQQASLAMKTRLTGKATAEQLQAQAEAKATMIMATAQANAANIRAMGDAKAAEIYANAYQKDPDFYLFYRNLNRWTQRSEAYVEKSCCCR